MIGVQARVRRQVRASLSVEFLFFCGTCLLLSPERRQIFFKVAHQRFRELRSFRTLRLRFKSGFKSGSNGAFGLVFGLVYLDLPTLLTLMVGLDRRQGSAERGGVISLVVALCTKIFDRDLLPG